MAVKYDITAEDNYLHCRVRGSHQSVLEYLEPFASVLRRSRDSNMTRVIFDYREIETYPNPAERIAFLEEFSQQYSVYLKFGGAAIRIAFITNEESFDGNELPRDVGNMMGFDLTRTCDLDEGIAWVQEDTVI